jgi:exopolysaccharide production protein ExoQ
MTRAAQQSFGTGTPHRPAGHLAADLLAAACILLLIAIGTDAFSIVLGVGTGGLKFLCYLAILGLCGLHFGTMVRGVVAAVPLLLLLMLCCASVAWSIDPGETAKRLVALVSCTSLGVLIGAGHSLRGLVLFAALLSAVTALVCLLAIAGYPAARGAPPWDHTWRGVFNHKNGLGAACAAGLPFALWAAVTTRGRARAVHVAGAVAILLLLVASASRTSQIIGLIGVVNLGLGLAFIDRKLGWAAALLIALGLTAGIVALLFLSGLTDAIFAAMGRKPTMSGRIPLWGLVWPSIEQRPLLGWGYNAFWDPLSPRVLEIARSPNLRFTPFYSHNGLVETLLAVGWAGAALAGLVCLRAVLAALALISRVAGAADLVPVLVFLVSFLLLNVTEASILQRDDMVWILFVAVAVRLDLLVRALRPAGGRQGAAASAVTPSSTIRSITAWPGSSSPASRPR